MQIRTPERWTAGVYANGVGVWSTQTEFTLDFYVSLPAEMGEDDQGNRMPVSPLEVVARVKIPPSLAFQVARNISDHLSRYEAQWGTPADFAGPSMGRQEPEFPPREE